MSDKALDYAALLRAGRLDVHFQPIVDLHSGVVAGLEALGRLKHRGRLIAPGVFLPHLSSMDLRELLFLSLDQGLAALAHCSRTHPDLRLSFNVDPALLLDRGFASAFLARARAAGCGRITIEILESGEFLNTGVACDQLATLRSAGVRVALDDVGSAYSSLMRLRTLPVDCIKLDQAFVRELHRKPEDLVFVSSMMSMAHGLGKTLVVEGVETPEILDAVRVLGVGMAQGYAIGRPMPAGVLIGWLDAHRPEPATSRPHSLLGSYAAHLRLVEACRLMLNLPLKSVWVGGADDPHRCLIGRYLDEQALHDTDLGLAHKHLHTILPNYQDRQDAWDDAAEGFRIQLHGAIRQDVALAASAGGVRACGNG